MMITIIARDFKPSVGGVAEYSHHMATELAKKHDVHVLSPSFTNPVSLNTNYANHKILPQKYTISGLYQTFKSIPSAVFQSDIVMSNCITGDPLLSRAVSFYTSSKLGLIVYAMDIIESRGTVGNKIREYIIKNTDFIIAISNFAASNLDNYKVSSTDISVIPGGVNKNDFRLNSYQRVEELRSNLQIGNSKVIFGLGRLVRRKGFDILIKSLPLVIEKVPDVSLIIGGDGPDRDRLESLARDYQVLEHIRFTGYVAEPDRKYYYHLSDVFAMPCREEREGDIEGFGIVFTEANACGLPVVGGRSGGATEAIDDGVTGLLVDPHSKKDVANSLVTILNDTDFAQELGQNGKERVHQKLNWDALGKDIRTYFNNFQ
jgi:phosphatidylinositol alpha-1,6-mannosyltransferase